MVATVLGLAAWCGLFGNQPAAHGQGGEAPVVITAIVPADAQIWFDGTATTQTGASRQFYSPPVGTGQNYVYRIRIVAGDRDDTRRVSVRGGDRITLDFTGAEVRETRATPSATAAPFQLAATPSSPRKSFRELSPVVKVRPTGQ